MVQSKIRNYELYLTHGGSKGVLINQKKLKSWIMLCNTGTARTNVRESNWIITITDHSMMYVSVLYPCIHLSQLSTYALPCVHVSGIMHVHFSEFFPYSTIDSSTFQLQLSRRELAEIEHCMLMLLVTLVWGSTYILLHVPDLLYLCTW